MHSHKKLLKNLIIGAKNFVIPSELNDLEKNGHINKLTPLKFLRYSEVSVPFSFGRTIRGLSFDDALVRDPFATFCDKLLEGESNVAAAAYLHSEYQRERYKSAGDIVGLRGNKILKSYPAWSLVLPWESSSIYEKRATYLKMFKQNRVENGADFVDEELLREEDTLYSLSNAQSQVLQTTKLWQSIMKNGLLPLKPLPGIIIMYDNEKWRWLMSGDGNHRAYLASFYGCEVLRAEIRGVVRRGDVKSWFNVKNGTYSEIEALEVFDSAFNGRRKLSGLV
jgi:hypothetical protein